MHPFELHNRNAISGGRTGHLAYDELEQGLEVLRGARRFIGVLEGWCDVENGSLVMLGGAWWPSWARGGLRAEISATGLWVLLVLFRCRRHVFYFGMRSTTLRPLWVERIRSRAVIDPQTPCTREFRNRLGPGPWPASQGHGPSSLSTV